MTIHLVLRLDNSQALVSRLDSTHKHSCFVKHLLPLPNLICVRQWSAVLCSNVNVMHIAALVTISERFLDRKWLRILGTTKLPILYMKLYPSKTNRLTQHETIKWHVCRVCTCELLDFIRVTLSLKGLLIVCNTFTQHSRLLLGTSVLFYVYFYVWFCV